MFLISRRLCLVLFVCFAFSSSVVFAEDWDDEEDSYEEEDYGDDSYSEDEEQGEEEQIDEDEEVDEDTSYSDEDSSSEESYEENSAAASDGLFRQTWGLGINDVKLGTPKEITVGEGVGGITYVCIPYVVTNSSEGTLPLYPSFRMINRDYWDSDLDYTKLSNQVRYDIGNIAVLSLYESYILKGGVKPNRIHGPFLSTTELGGKFTPGESRTGLAIFERPAATADYLTLIIEGVGNRARTDSDERFIMSVNLTRLGDANHLNVTPFVMKEKQTDWRWTWWTALKGTQLRSVEVEDPTGGDAKTIWAFDLVISNKTQFAQKMKVEYVDLVGSVEIDGVKLEVRCRDDGTTTLWKSKAMSELDVSVSDVRMFNGELAPVDEEGEVDEPFETTCVFDASSIDMNSIYDKYNSLVSLTNEDYDVDSKEAIESRRCLVHPALVAQARAEFIEKNKAICIQALNDAAQEYADNGLVKFAVLARVGVMSGEYVVLTDNVEEEEE